MTLAEVLRVDIDTFDKDAPVNLGEEPITVGGSDAGVEAEVAKAAEAADGASRTRNLGRLCECVVGLRLIAVDVIDWDSVAKTVEETDTVAQS